MMKSLKTLFCFMFACLAATAWSQPRAPQIIPFDVPGAGTGAYQGTVPLGIVEGNWISGEYVDGNNASHAFLRTPSGSFIQFDAPGAGTNASQGTYGARALNHSLEMAGGYVDANYVAHGFLRSRSGTFSTFDCPGAGTGFLGGTTAKSLNDAGVVSAVYQDANGVWHGCIRYPNGTMISYDPPDIGAEANQGTYPADFSGITPDGAITGSYLDESWTIHGYLRASDGTLTEFDDPVAGTGPVQGSAGSGINPRGEIVGWTVDSNYLFHGFLRAPDGTVTPVDIPGSGTGTFQGTYAAEYIASYGGINPAGTIAGFYADQNSVYHGFIRTAHGKITTFDVPGAGSGIFQGTLPWQISADGAVTGSYIDGNGAFHGFLRLP